MNLLLLLGMHDLFAKCVVNGIIIIINYVASKWVIFRKKEKREGAENERYYFSRWFGYPPVSVNGRHLEAGAADI